MACCPGGSKRGAAGVTGANAATAVWAWAYPIGSWSSRGARTSTSVSEAAAAEAAARAGSSAEEAVAPALNGAAEGSAQVVTPDAGEDAAAAAPEARAPRPRGVTRPRSWQALALDGHYSAAFERALEAGFESEEREVASVGRFVGSLAIGPDLSWPLAPEAP